MYTASATSENATSSPLQPVQTPPCRIHDDGVKDLESCTSSPTKHWFRRKSLASQGTVDVEDQEKRPRGHRDSPVIAHDGELDDNDDDDDDEGAHGQHEDPYSIITRSRMSLSLLKPLVAVTLTYEVDTCPDGYHRLATWQSSDAHFALFRGFTYSHCRVLCAWQNDISRLERQLDELDHWDRTFGDEYKLSSQQRDNVMSKREKESGTFPPQFASTRSEILAELRLKLMEYDEILLKTREMMSLQKPSTRDYDSVRNFFRDLQPIVLQESNFIRCKEDLITLRCGREYAGFDTFVEACLSQLDRLLKGAPFRSNIIQRLFLTPELRAKTSDPTINYYAPERVERLVNAIIALIIFGIMVVPVFAMYWLSKSNGNQRSPFEAIGILIISTLLFGAAMSALTKAKRAELFAASAAYCAVLVVFITNFSAQTVLVMNPVTIRGS